MTSLGSTINVRELQTETICVEWTAPDGYFDNHWVKSPSFQFCDRSWYLSIVRRNFNDNIVFYLNMHYNSKASVTITFILGIKKTDGTMHEKSSTLVSFQPSFDESTSSRGWNNFAKYNAEGIPTTNWILTCRMIKDGPSEQEYHPVLIKNYAALSANLKELLLSKNNCDVTIKVKDQEFQVHKAILLARSPVLAAAFKHDMSEKQTGVIAVEDYCPDSFKYFLDYLYTGTIEEYSWRNVYHLYIISDKYNELALKSFCLSHLMSNLTVDNVCDVFALAEQYDETELASTAQIFFSQNVNRITATCDWEKLMEDNNRLALKILKNAACNNENTINQLREELKKK